MISTNLPELYRQLQELGDVSVMDRIDTIELHFSAPVNTDALDDLVCDALFVDPIRRYQDKRGCILELGKRSDLRQSSDMRVARSGSAARYAC
jgi:hypothetical protein